MPVTPFHFGPGAVVHALAPRHVSFIAFCIANVLIDVEPLYFMVTGQYPLHRFFHTFIGASVMIAMTCVLFITARAFAARYWLPNLFEWRQLGLLPVALGAAAGSYSHAILDGIMHDDVEPFWPFSHANPWWRIVSLDTLHWSCLAAAGLASVMLLVRRTRAPQSAGQADTMPGGPGPGGA